MVKKETVYTMFRHFRKKKVAVQKKKVQIKKQEKYLCGSDMNSLPHMRCILHK